MSQLASAAMVVSEMAEEKRFGLKLVNGSVVKDQCVFKFLVIVLSSSLFQPLHGNLFKRLQYSKSFTPRQFGYHQNECSYK